MSLSNSLFARPSTIRLIEEADLKAAKELFGGADAGVDLDGFLPKSVKDFEDYAQTLASRYVLTHKDSKNYKVWARVEGHAALLEGLRLQRKAEETLLSLALCRRF